jgi:hypothetical protein
MCGSATPDSDPDRPGRIAVVITSIRTTLFVTLLLAVFAVAPVSAQSSGTAFCETELAETIKNVFTLIQFGGPLVGGVIALGATVAIPTVRRADLKKELKEARNQGLIWGVIVAPLGTTIVAFLLNNVVAGGASCGF